MKTNNITVGGISIALSIVILYLTTIIPINTIAILTLASAIIPIVIIRSNIKTSIFVYIITSILSFFFLPINYSILYILIFGLYGIVKYFIEKLNKLFYEIIIKLVFFNIVLFIGYFVFTSFIGPITIKLYPIVLFILAQIAFLIYDYALTIIITIYLKRIHGKI